MRLVPVLRAGLAGVGLACFCGCTLPTPAYRKVDSAAPAFRQAVAVEAEKRQAQGQSAAAAEKAAERTVTQRVIAEQKVTRTKQVTPLADIFSEFEKPRGCWAYTATTTSRHDGKESVKVERYDPFQPEAQLWTLVSIDGAAPDDAAQASYRERRLRAWKKSLAKSPKKYTKAEQMTHKATFADLAVEESRVDEKVQITYAFNNQRISIPPFGDIPPSRETYLTRDDVLTRQSLVYLGSASLMAGAAKFSRFDSVADYTVVDPALPPFVSRTVVNFEGSVFGKDTGKVQRETVYTDYRRVKCYEDRFETRIGAPTMSEVLPDN